MFEYLIIMLIFTLPFISYAAYRKRFKALLLSAIMGLVIGVPWDTLSACYFNTWYWKEDTLIGVWVGGLPLEEYLFMVLVPMMLMGGALIFKINLYTGHEKSSPIDKRG